MTPRISTTEVRRLALRANPRSPRWILDTIGRASPSAKKEEAVFARFELTPAAPFDEREQRVCRQR